MWDNGSNMQAWFIRAVFMFVWFVYVEAWDHLSSDLSMATVYTALTPVEGSFTYHRLGPWQRCFCGERQCFWPHTCSCLCPPAALFWWRDYGRPWWKNWGHLLGWQHPRFSATPPEKMFQLSKFTATEQKPFPPPMQFYSDQICCVLEIHGQEKRRGISVFDAIKLPKRM